MVRFCVFTTVFTRQNDEPQERPPRRYGCGAVRCLCCADVSEAGWLSYARYLPSPPPPPSPKSQMHRANMRELQAVCFRRTSESSPQHVIWLSFSTCNADGNCVMQGRLPRGPVLRHPARGARAPERLRGQRAAAGSELHVYGREGEFVAAGAGGDGVLRFAGAES